MKFPHNLATDLIVMRIGFFSPTINRVGGGEWVTLNMIDALKANKHKIVVYSAEKARARSLRRKKKHIAI